MWQRYFISQYLFKVLPTFHFNISISWKQHVYKDFSSSSTSLSLPASFSCLFHFPLSNTVKSIVEKMCQWWRDEKIFSFCVLKLFFIIFFWSEGFHLSLCGGKKFGINISFSMDMKWMCFSLVSSSSDALKLWWDFLGKCWWLTGFFKVLMTFGDFLGRQISSTSYLHWTLRIQQHGKE